MSYTTDTVKQIWNDDTGEHIYVGPDGDGVDLVELRYIDDGGTICSRFTMTPEQAVATAKAILELYGDGDMSADDMFKQMRELAEKAGIL